MANGDKPGDHPPQDHIPVTRVRRGAHGLHPPIAGLQEALLEAVARRGAARSSAEPLVRSRADAGALERLLVAVSSAPDADAVMSLLRDRPPQVPTSPAHAPVPDRHGLHAPKTRGPSRSRRRVPPREA